MVSRDVSVEIALKPGFVRTRGYRRAARKRSKRGRSVRPGVSICILCVILFSSRFTTHV